ncbi:MAG: glycerophosphodiester phosphodiesterase family protein [Alphaproteobacteria bacterium]|nr:glycerophosphodiester phosphodiesterase family protein [Alphaproteobacteria bacterium]
MTSLIIPKVIGHRGAKGYAPENTLASIHAAADMGIEWVEVDVKLSRDNVPFLFHDDDLERCTGAAGAFAKKDAQEIAELDAGSHFGDSFIGEKVPLLEDALEVILDRGLGANLELKPCPGREKETAEAALDIATRIWPEDQPPPLISSFSHVSLETAMDMIPAWPRGLLIDDYLENWRDLVAYLDVHTININADNVTPEQVVEYMEARKTVLAYTVNAADQARMLMEWGVDGVFSDVPDEIREAVETLH